MVERGAQGALHAAWREAWLDLLQGTMNHTSKCLLLPMTMQRPQSQPEFAAQHEQDEQGSEDSWSLLAWEPRTVGEEQPSPP